MISVVVPTYKERANIEKLVERTGAALASSGEDYELIIVDDGSPDGTGDEVLRLAATKPWLRLLVRENERDLSTAVIAGWRIARGDVLGCMDADLQHPPEMLGKLLAELRRTGADIVVGSRHVPGGGVSDWSLSRRFVSWTAALLANIILPGTLGRVNDPMSGFFLVRRSVLEKVALSPIGYKILLEVLAKGNYTRLAEVPFVFEEREKGGSKMTGKTAFQYLAHLVRISLDSGEALRMLKYAFVGLTGALVNIAAAILLFMRAMGWSLPPAALAGAALAIVNNFVWNEIFTFPETRRAVPGWTHLLGRFVTFATFSATGVAINLGVISILQYALGVPTGWSVAAGVSVAAVWNFLMNSNVTWGAWWNRKLLSHTASPPQPTTALDGLIHVPCNLCQSEHSRILYPGDAAHRFTVSGQTFRCTSEQHGDFTNIVECESCGLLYEDPREPEQDIEAQYQQVEDPTYEREKEGRFRTFSGTLERLEAHTRPGKLLDVGCYMGLFLDVARARGWETHGVEPSAWAALRAREKGHQIINAPLRKAALPAESFDMVTLWDVIEHLHDPLGQLREMYRLLKPGGIFALSTMDAGCLFAKLAGRHWPWFMRMHLYYFTRGTLTRMLQAAGFEVLAVETHKRIVSLRYLLEKGAALLGPLAPLGKIIGRPFGSVFVTVDLGDIINVYSRRPPA
jgi:dolichol-phosphate mannosyltransferase